MELYQIILIGVESLILFILVFFLLIAIITHESRFGKRADGNPNLKYFKGEDFNLKTEPVEFKSNKGQTLRGFIYSSDDVKQKKGVIIWVHGFGAGHNAYTTEIAFFAKQGYYVLGYDNTGCVLSDGKSMKGLVQGAIDCSYAVKFAQTHELLKDYKKVLIGHSWGAYSAMNIFAFNCNVDGVVAMCGFDSADGIITDGARSYFGGFSVLVRLFSRLYNRLHFGKLATLSSGKSISKSQVPVLLFYGERDGLVKFETQGKKTLKYNSANSNLEVVVCENKGHNVYLTEEAENYNREVFVKIKKIEKSESEDEKLNFYNSINYNLITEEDESVMNKIRDFIDKIQN